MAFTLENKAICKTNNLTVVIMILSAPEHTEHRRAIRETWANSSRSSSMPEVRTIFVIGRLKHWTTQSLIEKEFADYGDILQGNFEDNYKNLSLNSLYGYQWLNQNCANAEFVIKSDDDIVINFNKLFHAINNRLMFVNRTREVACFRVRSTVHRERHSKYFVGEHVFMNVDYTPAYCEGKFVLMTMDLIPDLLESAFLTPLFWLEDIYWYGLVMSSVPDITYTRIIWGEKIEPKAEKAIECLQKRDNCKFFITWPRNVAEIRKIYTLMEKDNSTYTETDFINATIEQEIFLVS
ncbi:beta-1,3-galactosyltransferase 1-like [Ruditapes philippinarum]|uniref:beta-1,3-galactosyltransferase 1-like n=1 Tax=Ruditapes philippinarum TaxID=129788 RepID=UPI00295C18E6|nr:beta-1,3-galactosyltransferase 1-like [Ruditapes philippinarum]